MASKFEGRKARIKLQRILRATGGEDLKAAMTANVELLYQDIYENAPIRTGGLRNSIKKYVSKDGLRGEVGFRGKRNPHKHIARFIEFGTKGYPAGPTLRRNGATHTRSVKVHSDGTRFFGKFPAIAARPARPFIQPAFDNNKDRMIANVKGIIDAAIIKAQQ